MLCYVFCHGAPGWGCGGTGMSCKIVTANWNWNRDYVPARECRVAQWARRCAEKKSAWIGTGRKSVRRHGMGYRVWLVRYRRAMSGGVGLGLRGSEGGGMGFESTDGLDLDEL